LSGDSALKRGRAFQWAGGDIKKHLFSITNPLISPQNLRDFGFFLRRLFSRRR